jgi:hypothetical protein
VAGGDVSHVSKRGIMQSVFLHQNLLGCRLNLMHQTLGQYEKRPINAKLLTTLVRFMQPVKLAQAVEAILRKLRQAWKFNPRMAG